MINERYRDDYNGEFVILGTKWSGGKKEQEREWVPNPIINQHISHRAVCIIGGRERFNYTILERHRGGLLSSKKVQTYGSGTIASEMRLDFTVEFDIEKLNEIKQRDYHKSSIVYTSVRQCLANPGNFYFIPYNPVLSQEAAVLYLAAFDGHKEIFMLGYNKDTPAGNNSWDSQVASVIRAYQGTTFYMLGHETTMPDSWIEQPNTKCLTRDEFISYCDI